MDSKHGRLALVLAAQRGHTGVVKVLLNKMEGPCFATEDGDGWKALQTAENGYSDAVWPLLDNMAAEGHKDLAANQRRTLKYKYDREEDGRGIRR